MDWFPAIEACPRRTLTDSDLMFSMPAMNAEMVKLDEGGSRDVFLP